MASDVEVLRELRRDQSAVGADFPTAPWAAENARRVAALDRAIAALEAAGDEAAVNEALRRREIRLIVSDSNARAAAWAERVAMLEKALRDTCLSSRLCWCGAAEGLGERHAGYCVEARDLLGVETPEAFRPRPMQAPKPEMP